MTTAKAAPTGAITLPNPIHEVQHRAFGLGRCLPLHCLSRRGC